MSPEAWICCLISDQIVRARPRTRASLEITEAVKRALETEMVAAEIKKCKPELNTPKRKQLKNSIISSIVFNHVPKKPPILETLVDKPEEEEPVRTEIVRSQAKKSNLWSTFSLRKNQP